MATIKDIAKKLNISTGTVSKGLNGASDISEALRHRILDTAAEMGREEVEVETFDRADFIADYEKQGYDPSVVEGLFPLLV